MKPLHVCCFLAASALIAKAPAQSFFVDFNTVNQFTDNFNVYQNVTGAPVVSFTGSPYSQGAASGVGGTGGLDVSAPATGITPDSTAIYKNTSFNFASSGTSLTISAMMKIGTTTETGNRLLQLGFVNDPTSGMNGNANLAFMSLRYNPPNPAGGSVFTPQWQTKVATGTTTVNTAGTPASVTLTTGDWYLMSLTFVNNGGGSIAGSGSLQDFGANGTTAGATTTLGNITLTSADIAADSSVYGAFRGFNADGLGKLDNFQATTNVPEPGTLALIGLGSALVIARRRRA